VLFVLLRVIGSGVARVPCALGLFLRPLSTKTTEFEVKNNCKNLEDAKLFFFEGNKPHLVLEMNFDKVVIACGSNNAGVWPTGMLRRFFISFSKNYAFLSILWSKFLLKMGF